MTDGTPARAHPAARRSRARNPRSRGSASTRCWAMPSPRALRRAAAGARAASSSRCSSTSRSRRAWGNWNRRRDCSSRAGIDPRRRASSLTGRRGAASPEQARHHSPSAAVGRQTLTTPSIPARGLFPPTLGQAGTPCARPRGERIEHVTIGGRTTAWVPARQR